MEAMLYIYVFIHTKGMWVTKHIWNVAHADTLCVYVLQAVLLGNAAMHAIQHPPTRGFLLAAPASTLHTSTDPLGTALAGGELPHLAACALCVLRSVSRCVSPYAVNH